MLRSVVEIASYGKMERMNDRYYGVRDLRNRDLYGKHMADIGGKPYPIGLFCGSDQIWVTMQQTMRF